MVVVEGIRIVVADRSKGRNKIKYNSSEKSIIISFPCADVHSCTPYEVTLPTGIYRFELWGAQGGYSRYLNIDALNLLSSGKGAYAAGTIELLTESRLYFYLGGMGENQSSIFQEQSKGGYNGGGNGGVDLRDNKYPESSAGGGGSSDIRLIKGNTTLALKSRIIVAAGGGGSSSVNGTSAEATFCAGDGGSLSGTSYSKYSIPGNQTYGLFGKGADGFSFGSESFKDGGSTGGSGGGYYGGITTHISLLSISSFIVSAAGGSSYVSGYEGCNSVNLDSDETPTHSGSPVHYTKRVFDDPVMMQKGNMSFVDPYGNHEQGHYGNGAIKITIIKRFASVSPLKTCMPRKGQLVSSVFYMVLLIS